MSFGMRMKLIEVWLKLQVLVWDVFETKGLKSGIWRTKWTWMWSAESQRLTIYRRRKTCSESEWFSMQIGFNSIKGNLQFSIVVGKMLWKRKVLIYEKQINY